MNLEKNRAPRFSRREKMTAASGLAVLALIGTLTACGSFENDSKVVNENMTNDAENFKIDRRITAINGITDKYLFTVEGKCNLEDQGSQLEVLCAVGKNDNGDRLYKKTMIGLSDNVTYVAEQIAGVPSDPFHYKLVFKPEAVIPDVEIRTSQGDVSTAP